MHMAIESDLALFYRLTRAVDKGEAILKETKEQLDRDYDALVAICPHSEAVERHPNIRGVGAQRRCKICGITDYASEGGTPGDEYDYGYPGHPSRSFWVDSSVEVVDEKKFESYGRHHDWVVCGGNAKKRF